MKNVCKIIAVLVLMVFFVNVVLADKESEQAKRPGVIYILVDRNITSALDDSNVKSRNQIADWWEVDLVNVLTRRGGYEAKLIQKLDEFIASPNSYLLTSKIVDYNAGSKAARMIVGFGAGACSMDLHNELFGAGHKLIFAKNEHVASGRDWKYVARKHNEIILKEINQALNPVGK